MKRFLSFILIVILLAVCFPVAASAYIPVADKDYFLSQYKLTNAQLADYEVFYEHKDADGASDWALVRAQTNLDTGSPAYYEFGNRVLSTEKSAKPFKFNVGIYNSKRGRFFDIADSAAEEYADMEAVWTELGSGRLLGDMDGDNALTVADSTIIQRCQAEIMEYPENDLNTDYDKYPNAVPFFSDFDHDGERGIIDASMIQRYLADMPHRTAEYEPYVAPAEPLSIPDDDSIPRITGFKSTGKGIEISIGAVPGAEKYRLFFKNTDGKWEKMGETTGNTFTATNTVEAGKTYTYTVRCIKADLSAFTSDFYKSGWSYTYDPQLDTPMIKRIEAVENGLKISWNPIDGADLYRVYYLWGTKWKKLGDTRDVSITDTSAYDGKNYVCYTVRCLSQGGLSAASQYDHEGTSFYLLGNPWLTDVETHLDGVCFTVNSEWGMTPGDIAVFRKASSGWKRIAVVPNGTRYTDKDVTPGKTYTYTCRCLSADGSYYVSRYNKTGWTQGFTVENCIPELEFCINMGDGLIWLQPKEGNKFDIPVFAVMIYDGDKYYGASLINPGEPTGIRDDFFKSHYSIKMYLLGLDENENVITSFNEDGFDIKMLKPASNLRVEKLADRQYRFLWDESTSSYTEFYAFDMLKADEDDTTVSDFVNYCYYDFDFSEYPEDTEWKIIVWATTDDKISASQPITLIFKESEYNS